MGWAFVVGLLVAVFLSTVGVSDGIVGLCPAAMCPAVRVAIPVAVVLLVLLAWCSLTQLYLRSGGSLKIGLAYDGHRVDSTEWIRIVRTLQELFDSERQYLGVSVRLVPLSATKCKHRMRSFMSRYCFTQVYRVEHAKALGSGAVASEPQRAPLRLKRCDPDDQRSTQLLQKHRLVCKQVQIHCPNTATELDLANAHAHALRFIFLLEVAAQLFVDDRYEEAARILSHLDDQLKDVSPDEHLRQQIRTLDVTCRLVDMPRDIDSPPHGRQLEELHRRIEVLTRYLPVMPVVSLPVSLMRFYMGDVDGALTITDEALQSCGDPEVHTHLLLNKAFLSFIKTQWRTSSNAYTEFFRSDYAPRRDWDSLVAFIRYVSDVGYDVSVLTVLYGRAAGKPVSDRDVAEARQWISADSSRTEFARLLEKDYARVVRARRRMLDTSNTKKRKSSKAQRRSKPRKKKRKGRKR